MKGKFGPYIKYKSLNATIPEEKDPIEISMEDALILIEKRKEYDKKQKKKKVNINENSNNFPINTNFFSNECLLQRGS